MPGIRGTFKGRLTAAFGCLLACCLLTSCAAYELAGDCDSSESDNCRAKANVCKSPTVRALAEDLDDLERRIDRFGSVVAQHPDVWGQARLTQHREDFEKQMAAELDKFTITLQGSSARSDQAYFADAFALSAAASAKDPPGRRRQRSSAIQLRRLRPQSLLHPPRPKPARRRARPTLHRTPPIRQAKIPVRCSLQLFPTNLTHSRRSRI